MNFQKIFWGILLLLLGITMLLKHLGIVHIQFWLLFHLWPVLLIIWGVLILPLKNNIKAIISVAILVTAIAVASVISERKPDFFKHPHEFYFHDNDKSNEEWDEPYFDTDSNTTDI